VCEGKNLYKRLLKKVAALLLTWLVRKWERSDSDGERCNDIATNRYWRGRPADREGLRIAVFASKGNIKVLALAGLALEGRGVIAKQVGGLLDMLVRGESGHLRCPPTPHTSMLFASSSEISQIS